MKTVEINMKSMDLFERAANRLGFNTERDHDRDEGITIVIRGPHWWKTTQTILR